MNWEVLDFPLSLKILVRGGYLKKNMIMIAERGRGLTCQVRDLDDQICLSDHVSIRTCLI